MARYTRKDAERCFTRFVDAIGARKATSHSDVGGLRLDYASVYGGVNIEEISNTGGGITHPFGGLRLKPADFCQATRYAEEAIAYRKSKGLSGSKRRRRKARR
jgi:hypothetical protein